ncbi:MAG TPA: hypothetical protein VGJ97_13200 [Anaerolineaceae bacterium]|jgi:hypothetical protein
MDKKAYRLEKLLNRKTGYPIATIADYGRDDQFASQVAVGIRVPEKVHEAMGLKKWFAHETDVRKVITLRPEVVDDIAASQVQRVILGDRIIGCLHASWIDDPEGKECSECSTWAHRDRWTGEILPGQSV